MFKVKKSVGFFTKIKQTKLSITENFNERFTKLEKRVEGTMAENWVRYWKNVCRDYKDVAGDVIKESREKPSKAILIGSTAGLLVYCAKHNPNSTHFRDAYIKAANDVSLVHPSLTKEETMDHLKYIEKCYNNQLIRHTSLGFISFIWVDNNSDKCAAFQTQCSYLQLKYSEIINRIIDVGFLDTWWMLAKKMTDYDINY
ncbi:PREDICTED: uncharacterized protein C19orf52 homolog [Nicrophorus vespilloides]|uniref:Uncharacterized protein C19orf52 homolog n=1 Tax=Nicrophorus vespilloides TaxID=110193 RepID=A0ABM1MKK1_NICVS|nr:PREDICTED: uncharacterized protein C19orf52 homolog [Nicrophorus vespilloides]